MRATNLCFSVFNVILGVAIAASPAIAQGRSDSAPGQNKEQSSKPGSASADSKSAGSNGKPSGSSSRSSQSGIASPVTAAAPTSAPSTAANAMIYYGSWLDDASIVGPGDVWIGLSTGYWAADAIRQIDAPVVSAAVGINSWIQAGGSASFYHFRDQDGLSETGAGSMSVYGKFRILDPARKPDAIGLAVTPLVEFSPAGQDQIGWALPVNIETRRGNSRFYGSTGYFSRGAVFATIAAEVPASERISITGNFGQSYARAGTHQTSFGVGAFMMLTSVSGAFVGLGQTLMPADVGAGGLSLAGGISFLLPQPKHP